MEQEPGLRVLAASHRLARSASRSGRPCSDAVLHHERESRMKIALLFDGASALGADPDVMILGTIEAIEAVLAAEGNQVVRVPAHTDGRWIERLRRMKADLVFNLCEGIDGIAALEASAISAIE